MGHFKSANAKFWSIHLSTSLSIKDCKVVYDSVGSVKPADVNYDNVIAQLLEVQREGYKRGVVIEVIVNMVCI